MSENQTRKPAIDMEFLNSVIDDDIDFKRELFSIFIENANRNIVKMEDAIKDNDTNSWYMASHAFKGASASIGAFDLSKVLEYAQKHPEDALEQKVDIIKKIKEEFRLVLDFINEELMSR